MRLIEKYNLYGLHFVISQALLSFWIIYRKSATSIDLKITYKRTSTSPLFRLFCLLFLLFTGFLSAQTVSVDANKSADELVNILLNNACAEIDNVSTSSMQATGYFNNNGGAFPIEEGVIIRTGESRYSAGPYTGNNESTQLNTDSDPFLQDLADQSGQASIVNDVSFLEFEFVPISESLSFDFLLASNEYGDFQCFSGDVLAFVLTDLSTGNSQNLAVVPGTTTPISVKNISDNAYNPTCDSQNADLFASYEVDNPNSTINMRGYTQMLNASATIVPGRRYKIRIVIGDSNDSTYDSAIFLSAGSFNTGVDLGPDIQLCGAATTVLDAGLDDPTYTYEWLRNGNVIPNETNATLTINGSGVYKVNVSRAGSDCLISDEIKVSPLRITRPVDLNACSNNGVPSVFDLTINDSDALNADGFEVVYYLSQADYSNNNPIPTSDWTAFSTTTDQTIFIKLRNKLTGDFCDEQYTFRLNVSDEIAVNAPQDINICSDGTTAETVDFSGNIPTFNNGQNAADFEISFYNTLADAQSATDTIPDPANYTIAAGTAATTIYLRINHTDNETCFTTTNFNINKNAKPVVAQIPDATGCASYTLPPLTNGTYYSGPGATGGQLNPGDQINNTSTVYVYQKDATTGCENETSFKVTILEDFKLEELRDCGSYKIPNIQGVAFYSASGGPNGGGNLLPAGMNLRKSQTIWLYAVIDGTFCRDDAYDIIVDPLPDADDPDDVITCNPYVLPMLTNGSYTENKDGSGITYKAGDTITKSTSLYVYNRIDSTTCERANFFNIFITPKIEDLDVDKDNFVVCGQYELPKVDEGAFYTQPMGQGTLLPKDTLLTDSQKIYYYVKTTDGTTCTDNLSFDITVKPIPIVDNPPDVTLCADDTYTLPELTNGGYYLNANGQNPVPAGSVIDRNITLYVYAKEDGCGSEPYSFDITFRPKPKVEKFVPVYSCSTYELPELKSGARYYTESLTRGQELKPGDIIDSTQTIYIYNNYPDLAGCYNETTFEINILGVDVGEFENVKACDNYVLPDLTTGGYFTAKRGRGTQLMPGDRISNSQTIYVYARNGTRFICESETSFNVEISKTPVLPPQDDLDQCGSLTLPALDRTTYNVDYYSAPGGQDKIDPADYTFAEAGTYTIYRYATATNNPDCIAEDSFEITVYPRPEFTVQGGTICTNPETGEVEDPFLLQSGLDPSQFTVFWELDGAVVHVGENFTATQDGIYTVRTEKVIPEIGANCNYNPTTVEVFASSKPILLAEVTQPFADVARITVTVQGAGDYLYSIDGGEFQTSNTFDDVTGGIHEISAKGITGNCSATTIQVNVVKFPEFFTPNNDGYNDTWNITTLADHPEARIHIFDRFGKLLKTIFPNGAGWDGTFRGSQMPSNDYWFKVSYQEDGVAMEFKSHFTLKR